MHTTIHALHPDDLAAVLGERTRVVEALNAVFRLSHKTNRVEQAASRIAQLLRAELNRPDQEPATAPTDQATAAFVEQWVIDVASMTDEQVAAVRDILGDDGLMNFIHSVLAIEQRMRLDLAWQQLGLLPASQPGNDDGGAHLDQWGSERASDETADVPIDVAACSGRIANGRHGDQRLTAALSEWQAAVVCLEEVDALTTELVRLRCANYHDCHT